MRTQAISKPRGKCPSPPFSVDPKSFPEGPLMTMPVLGHPSLEESYPSLANQSSAQGQAVWSKVGRGSTPAREISFVSLVASGPKVSHSALAWSQGWGLHLLKPGRVVPNNLVLYYLGMFSHNHCVSSQSKSEKASNIHGMPGSASRG